MKNINRESGDFHVIHEGPRPQEHGNSHLLSMADGRFCSGTKGG